MGKRLTYDFVTREFSKQGWKIIQDIYEGAAVPMKCKCPSGHTTTKSWSDFKRGYECRICAGMDITFDYVYNYFNRFGYELLSKDYVNALQYLEVKCPEGHIYKVKWNDFQQGHRCRVCSNNIKSKTHSGKNNGAWKGGVSKLNLPLYDTYAHQLVKYYKVYKVLKTIDDTNFILLGIECHYCGKVFVPRSKDVQGRILSINTGEKERNLYCSTKCKKECPIFYRMKYPKGFNFKDKYSRIHQKEWSDLVKVSAEYACEICGESTTKLIGHHEIPVKINELVSLDIDNGICLCEPCHKKVHQLSWCSLHYLRTCKKVEP